MNILAKFIYLFKVLIYPAWKMNLEDIAYNGFRLPKGKGVSIPAP
jgi:hypothetical protein